MGAEYGCHRSILHPAAGVLGRVEPHDQFQRVSVHDLDQSLALTLDHRLLSSRNRIA
jgi:hypothetical protein